MSNKRSTGLDKLVNVGIIRCYLIFLEETTRMITKSSDPADFPKFSEFPSFSDISQKAASEMLEKLNALLSDFWVDTGIAEGSVACSQDVLVEVFRRIEKRRVYFHVFYDECKMGELNEGALLCFWIAKLQPFSHLEMDSCKLNATIASYIFKRTIELQYKLQGKEGRGMSKQFVRSLGYTLMFRDISKEALMLLAESYRDDEQDEAVHSTTH